MIALLAAVFCLQVELNDWQVDLAAAERAYHAGRYQEAQARFESALAEPGAPVGALLHDIGNCALLDGRAAEAVLFYRRAALRLQGDRELLANLQLAERALSPEPAISREPIRSMLRALGPFAVLGLGVALQLAGVGAWFLARGRRKLRVAAGLFVALGLACSAHLLDERLRTPAACGVVLARGAPVRPEPHLSLPPTASLRAGELVRIEEHSDRWMRISHASGGGWIERAGVGIVD